MRKVLIIIGLLTIVSVSVKAQIFAKEKNQTTYLNYKLLENKEIIWQKIYETNKSPQEIINYFSKNTPIKVQYEDDTTFVGAVEKYNVNINPGKIQLFKYPIYFHVKIECKPNRYRVTISQIGSSKKSGVIIDGYGRSGGKDFSLEKEYISFGELNKEISKGAGLNFNNFLENMFSIKEIQDEW